MKRGFWQGDTEEQEHFAILIIISSPILHLHSLIPASFPKSTALLSWVLFRVSRDRVECQSYGSENAPLIQEHSKSHLPIKTQNTSLSHLYLGKVQALGIPLWENKKQNKTKQNRWITRRASRVAHQSHYHDVTKFAHLYPLCEVQLPSWGLASSDLYSPISQNHI